MYIYWAYIIMGTESIRRVHI